MKVGFFTTPYWRLCSGLENDWGDRTWYFSFARLGVWFSITR
jgi:hypothetical protein